MVKVLGETLLNKERKINPHFFVKLKHNLICETSVNFSFSKKINHDRYKTNPAICCYELISFIIPISYICY